MRHPTNRNLKCVDAYPLFPDQHSYTDAGGYVTLKFLSNPVPPSSTYDIRLESSILQPIPDTDEEAAAHTRAEQLHEHDPLTYPLPEKIINYHFFMPGDTDEAVKIKRKYDPLDEENASEELYTSKRPDGKSFALKRIRAYETATLSGGAHMFDEDVIIVTSDGTDGLRPRGAYYYGVCQKVSIRPRRNKNINSKFHQSFNNTQPDADEDEADVMQLRIEDPDEITTKTRLAFVEHPFGGEDEVEEAGEERSEETHLRTPESS